MTERAALLQLSFPLAQHPWELVRGMEILFMTHWFRSFGVAHQAKKRSPVKLSLQSLEGRAVPSHGVPSHDSHDDAPQVITPPAAVVTPVGDENHAPEIVDAQRGYPIPPMKKPKPSEVTVTPKPIIVLPPATESKGGPADATVVAINVATSK